MYERTWFPRTPSVPPILPMGAVNQRAGCGDVRRVFPLLQTLTGSATAYFELVAVMCLGGACWLGMKTPGHPLNRS